LKENFSTEVSRPQFPWSEGIALASLAVIVRLAYVRIAGFKVSGDGRLYLQAASNIANGSSAYLNQLAFQQLYPILLSPIFIFHFTVNPYAILLNMLLAVLGVYLAIQIMKILGTLNEALVAGLLITLSPNMIFWSSYALTETLFLATLGFFIFAHLRLIQQTSAGRMAVYLLATLLLLITRQVAGIAVLVSAGFLLAPFLQERYRISWQKSLTISLSGLLTLTTLVCLGALTVPSIRKTLLANEKFSAVIRYTVRMADNDIDTVLKATDEIVSFQKQLGNLPPEAINTAISRDTLNWIYTHPAHFSLIVMKRFIVFWHPWVFGKHLSIKHRLFEMGQSLFLSMVFMILLLKDYSKKPETLLLLGIALGFSLFCAVVTIETDGRFRLPVEYILFLLTPLAFHICRRPLNVKHILPALREE
jgi:hypothetical protein